VIDAEGTTTLKFYSVDNAGNAEGVTTKTVRIDRVAPVTGDDVESSYVSTATITFTPTDDGSGPSSTHWRLDSGAWTTGTVMQTAAQGAHVVEWYSIDSAGNRETPNSGYFTIASRYDNTDPRVLYQGPWSTTTSALLYGGTDKWTDAAGTTQIAFDGTGFSLIGTKHRTYGIASVSIDDSATMPVDLYSAGTSYQQRLLTVLGLSQGRHVVKISWSGQKNAASSGTIVRIDAVDVAGTLAAVDALAPVTTSNIRSPWYTGSLSATLSATDDLSGVRATYYRLNSGSVTTYTAGVAISSEGTHTFDYWSVDNYGNVETTKSATVRVDRTAPSTSNNAPLTWQRTPFSVSLIASDAVSGIANTYYTVNSTGTPSQYSGPIEVASDGVTTIKYWSVDGAGNTETTKTVLARLDRLAPTSSDDATSSWTRGPVSTRITSTDSNSGVARSFVSTDGTVPSLESSVAVITNEAESELRYFAVDSAGNTETVRSRTVRIDNTAPSVGSNAVPSYAGTATISLTASDALSGVKSVTYRVDSGSWVTSDTYTTSTPGPHVIQYYASDNAGNASTIASATFDVSRRFEQTAAEMWYQGSWSRTDSTYLSGGSDKWTQTPGGAVTASFDGTGVTWIGTKYRTYGIAAVRIDGGATQTVDLYNNKALYQQELFTVAGLPNGRHTITISYTGERHPASGGTMVRVDSLDVFGSLAFMGARSEQTESKLLYEGVWATTNNASLSGGSDSRTDSAGSAVTAAFSGTGIAWIGTKSPYYGRASVSLDGSAPVVVDMYATTTSYQQTLLSFGNLSAGLHTLRIEPLGTANPASSGTVIRVDAFDIQGSLDQAMPAGDPSTRYQQTDDHLKYSGVWASTSGSSLSGGSDTRTDASGGAVDIAFNGTGIAWVGTKAPQYGQARVSLDGGAPVIVDSYGSSVAYQQRLWATWGLTPGPHTLRIEWTGMKNPASSGTMVRVDAFDVAGVLEDVAPSHEPGTRFEQTDGRIGFNGTWGSTASTLLSGGSDARIDASGSVDATFTGTGIVMVATRAPFYGEALVSIDGDAPVRVDLYGQAVKYQDEVFVAQGLVEGTHTIKVLWSGTKNAAATGTMIRLDALDVIGGSLE